LATPNNKVRIAGGVWRSRLLRFDDATGLRPTPDRVRQTLFNWLGQELHGLRCLDLFAGTGALGFEAASRGAAKVVLVENNPAVYRNLQENARLLQAQQVEIVRGDGLVWMNAQAQKFDVIFLDPPFGQQWLDKVLPHVARHLAEGGLVYAEAEYALADTDELEVVKHGKAGNVFYHLLKSRHGT
jgi:16S rRNA (guanine(966)-N(2))-methyltransferase RsmD